MTSFSAAMSQRYQRALQRYLKQDDPTKLSAARAIGVFFRASGVDTLELAKLHEDVLVTEALLKCPVKDRGKIIAMAGDFYAAVITPIEKVDSRRTEVFISRGKLIEQLSRRTVELVVSNIERRLEIIQRNKVETELREKELRCRQLLEQESTLRLHSRRLSHRLLTIQEDERKRISHELHDVISQTLLGINVHLAILKQEAEHDSANLEKSISRTQHLVVHSVNIVHEFARSLRPALLDDIGLVPVLKAYLQDLRTKTGLIIRLRAYVGIDQLDINHRTVLYRVAQEALTNVTRHAKATTVSIGLTKTKHAIRMIIHDDGRSFKPQHILTHSGPHGLGLIGMRERLEMVDGTFLVDSQAGKGTTITAQIPLGPPGRLPAHAPTETI